ncbi:MAG: cysteine--tRNA ligase, partial [Gammaproteobacteria bacterium]|nr:cysteine--tRNA ligase [Gammaproteobacteria bacterium]
INKARAHDPNEAARLGGLLRRLGGLLGLLQDDPRDFLRGDGAAGLDAGQIEALIARRLEARNNKQWAESDRIRDELKAQGVILEDWAGGTSWRRE